MIVERKVVKWLEYALSRLLFIHCVAFWYSLLNLLKLVKNVKVC